MSASPLTVTLPEPVLERIRGRARRSRRTVEAEVVRILSEAVATGDQGSANGVPTKKRGKPGKPPVADPEGEALPPDISEAVAAVGSLDDRALLAAMKPLITSRQAKRLAALNRKAPDVGLSAGEEAERDKLLHVYDKSMIVRAAVMAELHRRGVNVAELIGT